MPADLFISSLLYPVPRYTFLLLLMGIDAGGGGGITITVQISFGLVSWKASFLLLEKLTFLSEDRV